MKPIKFIPLILILMLMISPAYAGKYALVIGNGSYQAVPELDTPVNDANTMAATLSDLGFIVDKGIDLTQQQMENIIRNFRSRIGSDDTALFYYSGHGVEVEGINYLIPIEIPKDMIRYKGIPVNVVLDKMEEAQSRVNIVILDACRSNLKGGKGFGKGLAAMTGTKGSFIAYATAPGTEAYTGNETTSIYTRHLVNMIRKPGLRIEDVFMKVRESVMAETSDAQMPWEHSSLVGKPFYFLEGGTPTLNQKYRLRSSPSTLSESDVSILVKNHNLFSKKYGWNAEWANESGDFKNDFVDNGNGTITDRATGLMWQKSGADNYINYEQAQAYVEKLNRDRFAGYSDWRLPTVEELASLLEPSEMNGDLYIDPIFDKTQKYCWTSDRYGSSGAWFVYFSYGSILWDILKLNRYVRVVRP